MVRGSSQQGFSMIEALVAVSVALTVISTITVALGAAHDSARSMERKEQELRAANGLVDLLFRIPVGEPSDPVATASQLTELFDGDEDLGTATLYGLRHAPADAGHRFRMADFPYDGDWEIRVSGDLDGNGDEDGGDEVFQDLLRIDVLFAGQVILQSARGQVMG